jgi:hypothetical protein
MTDVIVVDGDKAMFNPTFGPATVVVQPGTITGSGPAKVTGKKACVAGDESSVSVPGCTYFAGQYSIPGTGTLAISALGGDQKTVKGATGGKKLILKGSTFTAKFSITVPAQQPPPGPGSPIPDATSQYSGTGTFVATDATVKVG